MVTETTASTDRIASGHSDHLVWGASAALASVLLFSTMDAAVKWLGASYPVHQIMFFRCTVAFVPILIILQRSGGLAALRTAVRSLLGMLAMTLAFYGFTVMPLADAASVFYTAPLLAVAFSVPILGERVGVRRWLAVIFGLIGVLIIIRPGGNVINQGGLAMLGAAIFVALSNNVVRLLNSTDPVIAITFYFTLTGSVLTSIACILLDWIVPDFQDLLLLTSVGLLGGCAQYVLTLSFRYAEVGVIAPIKYLSIVFGAVLGFVVWSEVPDIATLVGMLVIITCGMYSMRREARLAREKGENPRLPVYAEK
jgi:drug/metabolite transporter (DMT)-like permease